MREVHQLYNEVITSLHQFYHYAKKADDPFMVEAVNRFADVYATRLFHQFQDKITSLRLIGEINQNDEGIISLYVYELELRKEVLDELIEERKQQWCI